MRRKWMERLLWAVAIVSLFAYGMVSAERWVYQFYADWEFTQMLTGGPVGPEYFLRNLLGLEKTSSVGIMRVQRPLAKPAPDAARMASLESPGGPLGRLEIPSIDFAAMVVEGDDSKALRRGIGHIPGTSLPGTSGNVGLAGHRDTFFRHLGEIQDGDPISVTTLNGIYDYVVDSIQIVDPNAVYVLQDIGHPVLTLVTCYPFRYVGAAPKRFIVHASLVGD